jgi:hypothetical protein
MKIWVLSLWCLLGLVQAMCASDCPERIMTVEEQRRYELMVPNDHPCLKSTFQGAAYALLGIKGQEMCLANAKQYVFSNISDHYGKKLSYVGRPSGIKEYQGWFDIVRAKKIQSMMYSCVALFGVMPYILRGKSSATKLFMLCSAFVSLKMLMDSLEWHDVMQSGLCDLGKGWFSDGLSERETTRLVSLTTELYTNVLCPLENFDRSEELAENQSISLQGTVKQRGDNIACGRLFSGNAFPRKDNIMEVHAKCLKHTTRDAQFSYRMQVLQVVCSGNPCPKLYSGEVLKKRLNTGSWHDMFTLSSWTTWRKLWGKKVPVLHFSSHLAVL